MSAEQTRRAVEEVVFALPDIFLVLALASIRSTTLETADPVGRPAQAIRSAPGAPACALAEKHSAVAYVRTLASILPIAELAGMLVGLEPSANRELVRAGRKRTIAMVIAWMY